MIGRKIGQYTITQRLGEGGMAVVYKAHQPSLNRDVAIKILTGPLARDEEFVTRFRREAIAAGALGHPNILTVHDAGTTEDGLHYIVMEHAPGGTLSDLLRQGALSPQRAGEIGAQIADALQVAHDHKIIHRDLKPSNILLARDGRPLLMDFGVALVAAGTRLTRTGTAVGTPEYMSPEQAQGLAIDERSDIYALGILLYEMLTGDVPFTGETPLTTLYRQVNEEVPRLQDVSGRVPAWMSNVAGKALQKEPDARYQTAGEMAAALRSEGGVPSQPASRPVRKVTARPSPAGVPVSPPARRRGGSFGWVLLVVIAVAAVAGGTYWFFFRPLPAVETSTPVAAAIPTATPWGPGATATAEADLRFAGETTTAEASMMLAQSATAEAIATAGTQGEMATVAAQVLATAHARETESAGVVAQVTEAVRGATETSVAMTAEAGNRLAASLTAEAATGTAQADATATAQAWAILTAEAIPTATLTPTITPTLERVSIVCGWEKGEFWSSRDMAKGMLLPNTEQAHSGQYSGKLDYDFPSADNDYVVLDFLQPLADEPDHLNMRVYGDGSGHFLNVWYQDAEEEIWRATFGQVLHTGWELMTTMLGADSDSSLGPVSGPDNGRVDYPIDFLALELNDSPNSFVGRGAIYLDHLVAKTASDEPTNTPRPAPAPPTATPKPVAATLTGRIAFPVFNTQIGKYDIYVAATEGSGRMRAAPQARQPDFRSDGRLAVNGDGGGRDNLWAMNADGSNAQAVSRHPEDSNPAWSPDGGRLAFDSLLGPDKSASRLYIHDDLSGKLEPRMLLFGSYEIRGRVSTWLSDGRIVFNGCNYWSSGSNCGLYAVGEGGGQPFRLTSHPSDTAADAHGGQIAYMSAADGNWEVNVMSGDGSGQRNLTQSPANEGLPAWSPDGKWLAFLSDRGGQWAVWAMRPDGSEVRMLFSTNGGVGTGGYDWSMEKLSWGP